MDIFMFFFIFYMCLCGSMSDVSPSSVVCISERIFTNFFSSSALWDRDKLIRCQDQEVTVQGRNMAKHIFSRLVCVDGLSPALHLGTERN